MKKSPETILKDVLSWSEGIPTVEHLMKFMKETPEMCEFSKGSAVCFDTNFFKNFGKVGKFEEFIDYFSNIHTGPIILPSQVVVEIWNNLVNFKQDYTSDFEKAVKQLDFVVEKIDISYLHLKTGASELVEKFKADFGFILNPTVKANRSAFMGMLELKAHHSQVSREIYSSIAQSRKMSKIPPGFLDDRDGDFYVWAEFLLGLLTMKKNKSNFESAFVITDDRKPDWSFNNSPHPVLSAEVKKIVGVPFGILTIEQLVNKVDLLTSEL